MCSSFQNVNVHRTTEDALRTLPDHFWWDPSDCWGLTLSPTDPSRPHTTTACHNRHRTWPSGPRGPPSSSTTPLPLLLKIRFGEGKLWRTRCATPEKGSGPHRSSPWVKQERRIVSWHFCLKVNLTVCTATCFLFTDSCDFYWNWCS